MSGPSPIHVAIRQLYTGSNFCTGTGFYTQLYLSGARSKPHETKSSAVSEGHIYSAELDIYFDARLQSTKQCCELVIPLGIFQYMIYLGLDVVS